MTSPLNIKVTVDDFKPDDDLTYSEHQEFANYFGYGREVLMDFISEVGDVTARQVIIHDGKVMTNDKGEPMYHAPFKCPKGELITVMRVVQFAGWLRIKRRHPEVKLEDLDAVSIGDLKQEEDEAAEAAKTASMFDAAEAKAWSAPKESNSNGKNGAPMTLPPSSNISRAGSPSASIPL